jgi:uncharacterized membrane protein YecN with MAPEG domain
MPLAGDEARHHLVSLAGEPEVEADRMRRTATEARLIAAERVGVEVGHGAEDSPYPHPYPHANPSPFRLASLAMPTYTALAAGPVTLLIALLGITISLTRRGGRASGPGFERLHRAHGNACEHVPLLLIVLYLAETMHAPREVLVLGAWGIIAARVLHAAGLLLVRKGPHPLQFAGATLTYLLELGLGITVLVRAVA